MSNPIAVALLAALTDGTSAWYTFNQTLDDATDTNTINANITVAGYSPGLQGDQLDQNSQGTVLLAEPIAITPTTGKITIGGWFDYDGIETNPYIMGLVRHLGAATQEVLTLGNFPLGHFSVVGWKDDGVETYVVTDPNVRATSYPITVRVQDSLGRTATSDQIIRITEGGDNPPGRYFVVATWDEGLLTLYVDSQSAGSLVVTEVFTSPIAYFQVGALGYGLSACGLDECFFMGAKAASQAEIDYLYNMGDGKSYAELEEDAA